MKVTTQKTVIVMLELTMAEAKILKGMTQNPLSKSPDVVEFCETVFDSLPKWEELDNY